MLLNITKYRTTNLVLTAWIQDRNRTQAWHSDAFTSSACTFSSGPRGCTLRLTASPCTWPWRFVFTWVENFLLWPPWASSRTLSLPTPPPPSSWLPRGSWLQDSSGRHAKYMQIHINWWGRGKAGSDDVFQNPHGLASHCLWAYHFKIPHAVMLYTCIG